MCEQNPSSVFIGSSNRLIYDKCYYPDHLQESTSPLLYKLNPNQIYNCKECLSLHGPRSSNGVSTIAKRQPALAQKLVDVESILTNRNVLSSKCRNKGSNDIDITKFNLNHARICNKFLNPVATHLTNPPYNYRDAAINRFYDLPRNPQENIFWDSQINTKLEAKDNYQVRIPKIVNYDPVMPNEIKGKNDKCKFVCTSGC